MENQEQNNKTPKIFISHSSKDHPNFGLFLFEMVKKLVGDEPDKVFYSSEAAYGVRNGESIIRTMKEQYDSHNLFMIVICSPNYMNSQKCLNEMGAAWVLNTKHTTFLVPNYDMSNLRGVYSGDEIAIQFGQPETIARLDMFSKDIMSFFKLPQISDEEWHQIRDQFLSQVEKNKKVYSSEGDFEVTESYKKESDTCTLKSLFSYFSFDLLEEFIKYPLELNGDFLCSYYCWHETLSSYNFFIYDDKLKVLVNSFFNDWSSIMRYAGLYDVIIPGSKYCGFNGYKHDVFESWEKEKKYHDICKQCELLIESWKSMFDYIKRNYKIDFEKLSNRFKEYIKSHG